MRRKAIVAGATGLIGRAIAEALVDAGGWEVVGLSRSGAEGPAGCRMIPVDLADAEATARLLAAEADATHLFYAAYAPAPSRAEEVPRNLALFRHLLEGADRHLPGLRHVVLVTGTKVYGVHLGPIATPARETDPRHLPPNFYFDQADLLRGMQRGRPWGWTQLIPPFVIGTGIGHPMNLVMALAVFALVSREHGLPLRFPGPEAAWRNLFHMADAAQVAAAALWACEARAAHNESFNVANGDPSRWSELWPVVARVFGMTCAEPKPMPLAEVMPLQEPAWRAVQARHGLAPAAFGTLVDWRWAEYMLRIDYPVLVAQGKLRRAGFAPFPDNAERLLARLRDLARLGVLPPLADAGA